MLIKSWPFSKLREAARERTERTQIMSYQGFTFEELWATLDWLLPSSIPQDIKQKILSLGNTEIR